MLFIFILIFTIKIVTSAYCGTKAVSFSFEVLSSGQTKLGCGLSNCIGWNPLDLEVTNMPKFYKLNKIPDGYIHKFGGNYKNIDSTDFNVTCTSLTENQCTQNQWVGGIGAIWDQNTDPLKLACCNFVSPKESADIGVAIVKTGQKFIGGDVKDHLGEVYAYDFIANINRIDANETTYHIYVARYYCGQPSKNKSVKQNFLKNIIKTSKLFQAPIQSFGDDAASVGSQLLNQQANNGASLVENNQVNLNIGETVQSQAVPQNQLQNSVPINQNQVVQSNSQPIPQSQIANVPPQTPAVVQNYGPPNYMVPAIPAQGYASNYYYPTPSNSFFGPTCGFQCFSADTKVKTRDGIEKRMDQLTLNDWVLSIHNGEIGYSKMNSWLHRKSNEKATFIKIHLENGKSLELTEKHYIFRTECSESNSPVLPHEITQNMIYANKIQFNDCLYVQADKSLFVKSRVIKLENVEKEGIYAPMTTTGNIVVNGIAASCYNIVKNTQVQFTFSSLMKQWISFFWSVVDYSLIEEIELIPGIQILTKLFHHVTLY